MATAIVSKSAHPLSAWSLVAAEAVVDAVGVRSVSPGTAEVVVASAVTSVEVVVDAVMAGCGAAWERRGGEGGDGGEMAGGGDPRHRTRRSRGGVAGDGDGATAGTFGCAASGGGGCNAPMRWRSRW